MPGTKGQSLIEAWCEGTSFSILVSAGMPDDLMDTLLGEGSPFCRDCSSGDVEKVRSTLQSLDAPSRASLLTRRFTNLRLTPLHCCIGGARAGSGLLSDVQAFKSDHREVTRLLLDAGAPVDAKDVLGQTPLAHATTGVWSPESLECCMILIEKGANVNPRNRALRTPLIELAMAVMKDPSRMPAASLLLEAGTDPSLGDSDGCQPIKISAGLDRVFIAAVSHTSLRRRKGAGKTMQGDRVVLKGLKAEGANGTVGVAGAYNPMTGRYQVTLSTGEVKAVKAENLYLVTDLRVCKVCGSSENVALCGGCKEVKYCVSGSCQAKDWKEGGHKAVCKKKEGVAAATALGSAAADSGGGMGQKGGGGGLITLQRPTNWRSLPDITTGGKTHTQWDLSHYPPGSSFVLKVQFSLISAALIGTKEDPGALCYDETRRVFFTTEEQPLSSALRALMNREDNAFRGVNKVYVQVERTGGEGITFDLSHVVEEQVW